MDILKKKYVHAFKSKGVTVHLYLSFTVESRKNLHLHAFVNTEYLM